MTLLIIESLAVILGILYLILAAKEDVKCWYAALISSLLFIYTMYQADLIMQSLLQVFYVIMAVYGWLQWSDKANKKFVLRIKRWRKINHLYAFILIVSLSILSGIFLQKFIESKFPFLDALTTWGAIITTYMVAKKIIENWIYWFVINSISIYLFILRELYLTSALFFIYLIIIIFGYNSWVNKLNNH